MAVTFDVDEGLDVPLEELRVAADSALDDAGADELTVRITDDELLQQLNREHRGIDEPTDVLSFSAVDDDFPDEEDEGGYLGDIAISLPAARRNSELTGTPIEREVRHLVVHGVLHLLGFDHETDDDTALMRAREVELLGDWVDAIWDAPPTH